MAAPKVLPINITGSASSSSSPSPRATPSTPTNSTPVSSPSSGANRVPTLDEALAVQRGVFEVFDRYDTDGNGRLDAAELSHVLQDITIMARMATDGIAAVEQVDASAVVALVEAVGDFAEGEDAKTIGKEEFAQWIVARILRKGAATPTSTPTGDGYPKFFSGSGAGEGASGGGRGRGATSRRNISKALPIQLERFLKDVGKVSLQIARASAEESPQLWRDFKRYLPKDRPALPENSTNSKTKLVMVVPMSSGSDDDKNRDNGTNSRSHNSTSGEGATKTPEVSASPLVGSKDATVGLRRMPRSDSEMSLESVGTAHGESRPNTPAEAISHATEHSSIDRCCELLHLQIGLRNMFEQFGHHDKTEDAGLTLSDMTHFVEMLPVFYDKVKSALGPSETAELEASMPNICTRADVPNIFSALDANKNGKIELREFSEWFIAGSLRPVAKQMSFAAKSPYNLRLTHLLRVVILISQCMVPYEHIQKFGQNIINLFLACHPRPIDLCIPPKNLKVMLEQVRDKMNTFHAMSGVACLFSPDSDAKIIFAALDDDGDGLVSEHEFFTWVLRGVAVSYYERNRFASSSPENMRILNVFEVICILCNGADLLDGMMLASQTPKAKDQALALGLKMLFDQFDVDRSGAIDREELQRLMIDLPGRYYVSPEDVCLPGDVALVMKTLDADGSGTVDFEEWKDWVLTGVKKSTASRAKFSAQSSGHRRLDRFMDTIMHISHELSAPLLDNETETVPGLTALFEEYNVAHDGNMVPKELKAMIVELALKYKEVQWFEVNDSTAAAIVLAVGGGGLRISLENWIQWMVRGARRPALKRARFSSASSQFKVLNMFLEGVLRVVRIRTLKALSASSHVPEYRRGCGRHTSGYAGSVGKDS